MANNHCRLPQPIEGPPTSNQRDANKQRGLLVKYEVNEMKTRQVFPLHAIKCVRMSVGWSVWIRLSLESMQNESRIVYRSVCLFTSRIILILRMCVEHWSWIALLLQVSANSVLVFYYLDKKYKLKYKKCIHMTITFVQIVLERLLLKL